MAHISRTDFILDKLFTAKQCGQNVTSSASYSIPVTFSSMIVLHCNDREGLALLLLGSFLFAIKPPMHRVSLIWSFTQLTFPSLTFTTMWLLLWLFPHSALIVIGKTSLWTMSTFQAWYFIVYLLFQIMHFQAGSKKPFTDQVLKLCV